MAIAIYASKIIDGANWSTKPSALFAQAHLDVAGGTNVGADMAADALGVIGIDIAASGLFILIDPEDGILRAEDDTVVTFEAHAATHTAFGLCNRLRLAVADHALHEMAQHFFSARHFFFAQVACLVLEMPQEQLVVGYDLSPRAILVIMDRIVGIGCSPQIAALGRVVLFGGQMRLGHLLQ